MGDHAVGSHLHLATSGPFHELHVCSTPEEPTNSTSRDLRRTPAHHKETTNKPRRPPADHQETTHDEHYDATTTTEDNNLRATDWDESSMMDRAGNTEPGDPDDTQSGQHAAHP